MADKIAKKASSLQIESATADVELDEADYYLAAARAERVTNAAERIEALRKVLANIANGNTEDYRGAIEAAQAALDEENNSERLAKSMTEDIKRAEANVHYALREVRYLSKGKQDDK